MVACLPARVRQLASANPAHSPPNAIACSSRNVSKINYAGQADGSHAGEKTHRHGEEAHDQTTLRPKSLPYQDDHRSAPPQEKIPANSGGEKNTAANVAGDETVAIAGAKLAKNTLGNTRTTTVPLGEMN